MMSYSLVSSFAEINSCDFESQLSDKVKSEIVSKGKEYILGVDEDEFKNYLINEYSLEPLYIEMQSETIEAPKVSKETVEDFGGRTRYPVDVYNFIIKYEYTGSAILFRVRPSTWTMTSADIYVDHDIVSFSLKLYRKDPDEFQREKILTFKRAFANLDNINAFTSDWNCKLPGLVNSCFKAQKMKYLDENDFFAAINVKVNNDTLSVFTTPTIKKKIIPQPTVSKNKEFSSEPAMAKEMYADVLKVIYDLGKNMEKKPSTYQNKDEEGLRDQLLLVLETRYDGITATGETFNHGGKTDIILKYAKDSSNLFVAECKFWHGSVEFHNAISQLFDKYLTWRDSKVALILFVKNKDFTNVIQTIKTDVKSHPYYVKENGVRGETSFSYIFHLPLDINKYVYIEIIAFHYDK